MGEVRGAHGGSAKEIGIQQVRGGHTKRARGQQRKCKYQGSVRQVRGGHGRGERSKPAALRA
eukprot:364798-Chlamydomonas_euryale.AAC.10